MFTFNEDNAYTCRLRQLKFGDIRAHVVSQMTGDVPPFNVGQLVELPTPEPRRFVTLMIHQQESGNWEAELKAIDLDWVLGETDPDEDEDEAVVDPDDALTPPDDDEDGPSLEETLRDMGIEVEDDEVVEAGLPSGYRPSQHTLVAIENSYENSITGALVNEFHCPSCKERGITASTGPYKCSCSLNLFVARSDQIEGLLKAGSTQRGIMAQGMRPRKNTGGLSERLRRLKEE